MSEVLVDFILPTDGKRIAGLNSVIGCCINQVSADYTKRLDIHRINVMADGCYDNLAIEDGLKFIPGAQSVGGPARQKTYEVDGTVVRICETPNGPLGKWGHGAIKWAVENLDLAEWFFVAGDDDVVMPWAIDRLLACAGPDTEAVIGRAPAVKRKSKASYFMLGDRLEHGLVTGSCGLYRTKAVREIGYGDKGYAEDWELIRKLLSRGRLARCEALVYVLSGPME